jgi:periplasmic protein TonB
MKSWCFRIVAYGVPASAFAIAQQSGGAGSSPTQTAPNADSGQPQRVRISSEVAQRLLISKGALHYPDKARHARIQGTVVLRALIDVKGNIEDLTVVSGHPELAPAALEAVAQCKYKPYLLNGQPVEVETQVTVHFTLSRR